jgi:hypothetical protein
MLTSNVDTQMLHILTHNCYAYTVSILRSQVTAAAAVKVQATWLVARGLNPAVPCGYSILIDAPVPKNPADMCTSAAANKAKV